MRKRKIDIMSYLDLIKDGKQNYVFEVYHDFFNKDKPTKEETNIYNIFSIQNDYNDISKGMDLIRDITYDDNIDYDTLSFKDKTKTKEADRLLLLFFLENGVLNRQMLLDNGIQLIYLDKLKQQWNISTPIAGVYILEDLPTYWTMELTRDNLIYLLYAKDNMVVYESTDLQHDGYYWIYVNKAYRGLLPSNNSCSIKKVDKDNLLIGSYRQYINSDMYYNYYDDYRKICELINKTYDLFKTDFNTFIETYEGYKILELLNLHLEDNKLISTGNMIDADKLKIMAISLGVFPIVKEVCNTILSMYDYSVMYSDSYTKTDFINNTEILVYKTLKYLEKEGYNVIPNALVKNKVIDIAIFNIDFTDLKLAIEIKDKGREVTKKVYNDLEVLVINSADIKKGHEYIYNLVKEKLDK